MSYNSHRRPTPVPTDSILVFGREIGQLPSISESPSEKAEVSAVRSMEALNSSQEKLDKGDSNTNRLEEPVWTPLATSKNGKQELGAERSPKEEEQQNETKNVEQEPLMQNAGKTDFRINFPSGVAQGVVVDEDDSGSPKKNLYQEEYIYRGPEESLKEALLAVLFAVFHVAWSVGVAFWHLGEGNLEAGYLTLALVFASGILTELTYYFNGKIQKGKIWASSKVLWLLFLIPCTLPTFMAFSNLVYAFKESRDPNYSRPWTNSRIIFLVESLALVIPQIVLQTCLLMEEIDNFPSLKGSLIGAGLLILTLGLSFARIRFDSMKKMDRFAMGTEKYIRYSVIWASKVLWLLTHCCLIVSVRIIYGRENYWAVVLAIVVLQMIYEIPLLMSSVRALHRISGVLVGTFFLLPQFAALITLVLWVNVDMTVYKYNIGSCVLGLFFGAECLCILGWLLDRCTDRENDFIPSYPHIFGNLYMRCCK